MHHDQIEYRIVQEWDCTDIINLYRSAGWWEEEYDPAGIIPLIRGSTVFMVGVSRKTGKALAMGRILSDHIRTGYIQDLCVLTSQRGNRIGTSLLQALVKAAEDIGITVLHLIAEPGTEGFYQKAEFQREDTQIVLITTSGGRHDN